MNDLKPLVHLISNEVTINNVVNVILGAGGRAICANDVEEVAEITKASDALVINIGMPSREKLEAMLIAGKMANEMNIPVVLDPVGVGASEFRSKIVDELLKNISFTCIKGNHSEIAKLCGVLSSSKGVDSNISEINSEDIQKLSAKTGAIIVSTGEVNVALTTESVTKIHGGSRFLRLITGSGCMLSGYLGVYLSKANQKDYKEAVVEAVRDFNLAAKKAELDLLDKAVSGNGSYLINLLDRLSEGGG